MIMKGYSRTFTFLLLGLAVLSLFIPGMIGRPPNIPAALFLLRICFFIGLFQLVFVLVFLRFAFPRITLICDGMLVIKSLGNRTVPLSDCQWYIGNPRQGTSGCEMYLPKVPALVIQYPGRIWMKDKIALCIDPVSRKRWIAFLTLSGVPRKEVKKGFFHFLRSHDEESPENENE